MFGYQIINMLLLSLWISDETLPLVFIAGLLGVWISDATLLLVLMSQFSVFGYQINVSSRFTYYYLVFGNQIKHYSCLIHYLSVFGYQGKQFSVFR